MSDQDVLDAVDAQEPKIREAFLAIIFRIISVPIISAIESLIRARRYNEIATLLRLTEAAFSPLIEAIRQALIAGGTMTAESIDVPGLGAIIHFDARNVVVENWLKSHSSTLVRTILADQQNAIDSVVLAGIEAGRNPRSIALDIVGRIDSTGRRVGGIVGLTDQQAQYVLNARAELEALSSDYFTRVRRDLRFDSKIRKAIAAGENLSATDIESITARYADRLLKLRGDNIGRTQALGALNAGRQLAYQQAVDDGTIDAGNITSTWETAHDSRVRDTHAEMQGQKIDFGGVFISPDGARLKYPGDTSLGAGAADVINCRCIQSFKVDFLAQGLANAA